MPLRNVGFELALNCQSYFIFRIQYKDRHSINYLPEHPNKLLSEVFVVLLLHNHVLKRVQHGDNDVTCV